MKKLELKHLSPYLPYGLKVMCKGQKFNVAYLSTKRIAYINQEDDLRKLTWEQSSEVVKPILNPLKNLTGEMASNCGYKRLKTFIQDIGRKKVPVWVWDDLLNNHWDVFNLIPEGLAIDINTLNS